MWFTIDLSDKVISDLDEVAETQNITRADAMRRALGLLKIEHTERARGNELAIVDGSKHTVVARLVGA